LTKPYHSTSTIILCHPREDGDPVNDNPCQDSWTLSNSSASWQKEEV